MHPTSHHTTNNVDATIDHNHHQNGIANGNGIQRAASAVATNGVSKDRKQHQKEPLNNNDVHNGNSNGTALINGNGNGNGNGNSYQNGGGGCRRDSTHVWSPLLQASPGDGGLPPENTSTVLYGPPSNNNEWKEAEEVNNLKNGLHHQHNNNHNNHLPQTNNNGSLMNGKNGIGITDKYNEQDPLTGLYKQRHQLRSESDESDFDSEDSTAPSCGIFGCRPKWARNFASTHVFMTIFLLAYILQGMYMTYFVSVITTIEKLFQIKSRTTGLLLSASEMGQISTAMLLTYFAGRGHRPRWIACGMALFSVAAFSCALPHFIFGEQLMQSTEIMLGSIEGGGIGISSLDAHSQLLMNSNTSSSSRRISAEAPMVLDSMSSANYLNLCLAGNSSMGLSSECDENRKLEQASHSKITVIVLCIFFASLLSSGIGQTAIATLGIPYIDDNVASKQSPIYIAITIGVRILGPASGFIVGSMCTRWYVNFSDPGFDASDPRWIGAWWLGPVIIGTLMMIASIAMFSFPKQLHGRQIASTAGTAVTTGDKVPDALSAEPEEKPKLKDFPKTVRRQLSNDILMFRTASCVFHLLPIAGLYTFLPKYLETQFRLAAYDANMTAAFCGILVMGFGIVISGVVILKLKPTAKSVAAWIAFTALFYSAGMVILMFVGCNMNDFAGLTPSTSQKHAIFEPTCNLNCTCDMEKFAPICGVDGRTYFSSCHAGCTMSELRGTDNRTVFTNCACIPDYDADNQRPYEAVSGYCDSSCKNFILFILIFAVCVFMHSTSEVGSMLVVMRCTHPKDKAMAMGVIQSAIGLFGNVPCPIIYGAVVDSACLVWKTVCGKHGACSLYDVDTFRHYFLGITAAIMFLAFIMDVVVWSKAHRIDIAPQDEENKETDCKKSTAAPDTTV